MQCIYFRDIPRFTANTLAPLAVDPKSGPAHNATGVAHCPKKLEPIGCHLFAHACISSLRQTPPTNLPTFSAQPPLPTHPAHPASRHPRLPTAYPRDPVWLRLPLWAPPNPLPKKAFFRGTLPTHPPAHPNG